MQYAYKKDGKGERHGDQAERMLAAQARKHNLQPPIPQLPPQFGGPAAQGPPVGRVPPLAPAAQLASGALSNGDISRPISTGPPESGIGRGAPPVAAYQQNMPSLQQTRSVPPVNPLVHAPMGLPARPPPSQAPGYGGPQTGLPPGFSSASPHSSFAPPQATPQPGFGPPPGPPPGFGLSAGAPGVPPPLPPGFQQPGFGRGAMNPRS